jgi:superfamily II DNA or RNA helicase
MSLPSYEELLARIEQLEKENHELRIRCGLKQPVQKPKLLKLSPEDKIKLFRSLFRGRDDVFARRWYNKTSGKSGYQPVCSNEWCRSLCDKKKHKCAECPNRKYEALTYQYIYNHLAGKDVNGCDVIGMYAILKDNTCYFLCADFDDKSCEHGYKEDVIAFVSVCEEWHIPVAIERSRSGNGAHVWIFFSDTIPAVKARQLGYAVLNEAMDRSGRISFKSYDRFIPNQDYLPDGGLGNLIALPLQGMVRKNGNSLFVDKNLEPYPDQWIYLKSIKKIDPLAVESIIRSHYKHIELSKTYESKPWEIPSSEGILKSDLPPKITIVRANQLYIPMTGLNSRAINFMRRLASFHNPEFYSKQAMRFSTFATPRIISCAEVSDDFVALPRGCENAVLSLLDNHCVNHQIEDQTNRGSQIDIKFKGKLYPNQAEAVAELSQHNNGILCATTAFGKTVAAIGLIAKLQINTLILVHTRALQDQWIEKLNEFLSITYDEPKQPHHRGRKKKFTPIGSSVNLHGIIDVVTIQSCINNNSVKDFINNYGLVIVDECHHVSAVSFEQVLKAVRAKYVYGLTATPIRKDGLQPIIFMQCGPIRYQFDSKAQIDGQSFRRLLISRFTSYRCILSEHPTYATLQQDIAEDVTRNTQIITDVKSAILSGRTPIIITTLRSHVTKLAALLSSDVKHVIELVGSNSQKEKRLAKTRLSEIPEGEQMVIIATGKYVGEGFDYPRLDTLFLAMPISWKGTIAQYAGRLHRSHEGKIDVQIYDYVDIHNQICEKMYRRRLKGYAAIGYKTYEPTTSFFEDNSGIIYNGQNFEQSFLQSLNIATKSVVISAPQLKFSSYNKIVSVLSELFKRGVSISIFTQTQNTLTEYLKRQGVTIHLSDTLLYCAIIDKSTTWYGSINYLGYNSAEQNAIKITNNHVAIDIIASISNAT